MSWATSSVKLFTAKFAFFTPSYPPPCTRATSFRLPSRIYPPLRARFPMPIAARPWPPHVWKNVRIKPLPQPWRDYEPPNLFLGGGIAVPLRKREREKKEQKEQKEQGVEKIPGKE